MKILVINGPNMNLLGQREIDIYCVKTLKYITKKIEETSKEKNIFLSFFQSNHEG